MKIHVKDHAPELTDKTIVNMDDGYVSVEVDDDRYATLSEFVRNNRTAIIGGAAGGRPWNRGTAKDATEAESFAIGQLTYLEAKAFARWYQPLRYEEILAGCIDYSAGPQAKAVDYLVSDGVGVGKFLNPGASDIPMVDVAFAKNTIPVGLGGIGYDYTTEDLRTSAFLGQPLPMRKQSEAIMAYKRHANRIALQGDAGKNFKGLYNNAGVTAANRLSGAVWGAATGDTIVADIIDGYQAYRTATGGNEVPTDIIFPLSSRNVLYKPRSTVSDTTIQKFIEETLKVTVHDDIALEALGSGATKRVVFCNPKNDNVVFHIPMPIQFLAPQLMGLRVVVPAEYKLGGLEVRRIQTVRYMDGV